MEIKCSVDEFNQLLERQSQLPKKQRKSIVINAEANLYPAESVVDRVHYLFSQFQDTDDIKINVNQVAVYSQRPL